MPISDDTPIDDDCVAFRLVRPDWQKPERPSSAAFQDHADDGMMSVYLADKIAEEGRDPAELLTKMGADYKLCELTVGELRALGESVTRTSNDFFPGHADCKN